MKFLILAASLTLANFAQAATTDFDVDCAINKINNDQYLASAAAQENNLFRIQLSNGQARVLHGVGEKVSRNIDARKKIRWSELVQAGPAQIKNARWKVNFTINTNMGASVSMQSYSRNNNDPNPWLTGELTLSKPIRLASGEDVTFMQFAYCLPHEE